MTLEQIKHLHPVLPHLLRDSYEVFGVSDEERNSRLRASVQARGAFLMLVRSEYHHAFGVVDLGRVMAAITGRAKPYDHATVIHAISEAEKSMFLRDEVSQIFRDNVLHLKKTYFPFGLATTIRPITKPLKCPIS